MNSKNFLPLPKTPRRKTLGSWMKSVNPLSLFMKNLKKLSEKEKETAKLIDLVFLENFY